MKPKNRNRISFILLSILISTFLLIVFVAILLIYPYNGFSVTPLLKDQNGAARIETDTGRTLKDGTPIVNNKFTYKVNSCNAGYDITATKWFDRFGSFSTSSSNQTNLDADELAASILINETIFRVDVDDLLEDGCAEGTVVINISDRSLVGSYYRLRTEYSYQPNFLKTEQTNTYTQMFYVEEEQEAP